MRLTREKQEHLLNLLYQDFGEVKRHTPRAWDGWEFIKPFDLHSPCANMCVVTTNGSEIKIFTPNSFFENWDNEEFNKWSVWFDVYGMGESENPEEFDSIEEVVGYLLEQWDSNNL